MWRDVTDFKKSSDISRGSISDTGTSMNEPTGRETRIDEEVRVTSSSFVF